MKDIQFDNWFRFGKVGLDVLIFITDEKSINMQTNEKVVINSFVGIDEWVTDDISNKGSLRWDMDVAPKTQSKNRRKTKARCGHSNHITQPFIATDRSALKTKKIGKWA